MTDPGERNHIPPVDLTGPLPRGTLVLRASAGTGKTYSIAALATRAIAEGRCTLPELLIVTFTRAATAELGDRVRRRLVQGADHLESLVAGMPVTTDDPVLQALGSAADPAELARRATRLASAVTSFDAATITTIHGFCQQVLRSIGLSVDDADATLVEDQSSLIHQVVSDLIVARFHTTGGAPPNKHVVAAVRAAMDAPDADIHPDEPPATADHLGVAAEDPEATGRLTAALARDARDELARRKRALGLRSHDDLLTGLRDAVFDPVHGDAAVATLRNRYRIALIDEFQDTDPIQWSILRRVFADPAPPPADRQDAAGTVGRRDTDRDRALVLIGDPKQAIYGFRGADVRAYLDATGDANRQATLADNHRSDERLLRALDELLQGTVYGDERIVHTPSRSPSRLAGSALGGTGADPVELRVVTGVPGGGKIGSGTAMPLLVDDVAAEVVRTLHEVTVRGRPAEPHDVAVLTGSNDDALAVQTALRSVEVPAVINSVGSVLETDAARQWQQLLAALQRPANAAAARAAAITDLIGWDAAALLAADDHDLDELHARLHRLAEVVQRRGIAGLQRQLEREGLAGRVLAAADGERQLTDLEHVAELLHGAQLDGDLTPAALTGWMQQRAADAADGATAPEEQTRRLESDADAVQVLTIHRSKGLEFGIVLAPFLWKQPPGISAPVTVHTDAGRVVDVGPSNRDGFDDAKRRAAADGYGDQLRRLYVAFTRARHRVVVWWLPTTAATRSALAPVLFARDDDGRVRTDLVPTEPVDPTATVPRLRPLLQRCGGRVLEVPLEPHRTTYTPAAADQAPLSRAVVHGAVDPTWRRSSYSALVRSIDPADAGDAPEDRPVDDTTDDEALVDRVVGTDVAHDDATADDATTDDAAADDPATDGPVPPMGAVPGSAELGTMIHAVLEHADTTAADLDTELAHHLDAQRARHLVHHDRDALLAGLAAAVTTPLGPLAGDITLRSVPTDHRLDEPRFELPLAGGDHPRSDAATLAAIGGALEEHLADDDLLSGYGQDLAARAGTMPLRGYLTGAIDLVLRVEVGGEQRYLVVDHKTNRLGPRDRRPAAADYRPRALATAMRAGDYPLQALLYQVALHRLLRWRQRGYDPERHLGGALYLFLRGMVGPATPRLDGGPCGVFAWRPPAALVVAVSELLEHGVVSRHGGRP